MALVFWRSVFLLSQTKSLPDTSILPLWGQIVLQDQGQRRKGLGHSRQGLRNFEVKVNMLTPKDWTCCA